MPLIILFLTKKEDFSIRNSLKEIIKYSAFWAIGYFGIWFSKWIIADLIYHEGITKTAINQFLFRSYSKKYSSIEVLWQTFKVSRFAFEILIAIVIFCTAIKVAKIIIKGGIEALEFNYKECLIYFIIGFMGIVWMLVLKQHTYKHYYFTYRNWWLISTCIFLIIYNLFKSKDTIKRLEK